MTAAVGWPAAYVGIPYQDAGRTREGMDCWGLVRFVLSNELGYELPSYASEYTSARETDEVAAVVAREKSSWREIRDGEERAFDVALLWILKPDAPSHVGVVVAPDRMLHTRPRTGVVLESYRNRMWGPRLVSFHRYEP